MSILYVLWRSTSNYFLECKIGIYGCHTWTLSYSSNNGTARSFKFLGTAKYSLSDKWTIKSFLHSCVGQQGEKNRMKNTNLNTAKNKRALVETKYIIWLRALKRIYLWFCYVGRAVGIHYGFKIWPPPDSNTFTYLQVAKECQKWQE